MDISNIFLLYDGDGSPESPFLVPVVGFAEALVTLVTLVILVKPIVLAGPLVGGVKQLRIKNNKTIIKEEEITKLNKPDTNYAGVMAPVTQQPCIIIKFHSIQWKQGVGKYSQELVILRIYH